MIGTAMLFTHHPSPDGDDEWYAPHNGKIVRVTQRLDEGEYDEALYAIELDGWTGQAWQSDLTPA